MDLGSAFAASVMHQPRQEAFVEGNRRMTYADWYREIAAVAGGLQQMGLKAGDHLVVVMRVDTRWRRCTGHASCSASSSRR
jgi:2-furoate---CoA ligase